MAATFYVSDDYLQAFWLAHRQDIKAYVRDEKEPERTADDVSQGRSTIAFMVCPLQLKSRMPNSKLKLLAATVPSSGDLLAAIYGDAFKVLPVHSFAEALAGLDTGPNLVTCNIHFAEGALFDLLRAAKAHPLTGKVPFLVIDATPEGTLPAIAQSIEIASTTLGADEVLHVTLLRAQMGDDAAFEEIRRRARAHIAPQ